MDIYDRINKLLETNKKTRRKLAADTGISYNTLTSLFARRSKNIEIETVRKIAVSLNTTVEYLVTGNIDYIERSSIDPSTGQAQKVNQVIAIARGGDKVQYDLTEAEMQAIIALLDTMKKDK